MPRVTMRNERRLTVDRNSRPMMTPTLLTPSSAPRPSPDSRPPLRAGHDRRGRRRGAGPHGAHEDVFDRHAERLEMIDRDPLLQEEGHQVARPRPVPQDHAM